MDMCLNIRTVCDDDCHEIAAIYNHYVATSTATFDEMPVGEDEMYDKIKSISSGYPYLVAEYDGKLIGFCYAHQWKEKAAYRTTVETTVYVRPGFEHRGVGKALMCRLIRECRTKGYKALIACVTADNEGSLRLHDNLGFKRVSHFNSVGMKFGRWLDIIDYELTL